MYRLRAPRNGGGEVTSQAAVVDVLPRLVIKSSGNILKLTWPSGFALQAADIPMARNAAKVRNSRRSMAMRS